MCKTGSFSISGSPHVSRMKLGMDIKYIYIKCMLRTLVLFGYLHSGDDN